MAPRRSHRLPADLRPTALATRLKAAAGAVDLTVSNPTKVGLTYPGAAIREALAGAEVLRYEPAAAGEPRARAAAAKVAGVEPGDVILTASTSESYALLFQVLCDPGDAVAVPAPSYPLFEHLARLQGVRARSYSLEYDGRWRVDTGAVRDALAAGAAAVVVVNPNNPTGSAIDEATGAHLRALCAEHDVPLIADEVFRPYGFAAEPPSAGGDGEALTVVLDGLSKRAALPQLKLGWMALRGPSAARAELSERLEWAADAYLSVGAPVQVAAPRLLELAPAICAQVRARVAGNRARLSAHAGALPEVDLLAADGGWSAVLRVPAICGDDEWVVRLAEEARVIVQPGFFYDFAAAGYLVVSLLPDPAVFEEGCTRLFEGVRSILAWG
jgi:hypothetical protein